jgi:alkaline phosphatase isozyme conversion protein
MKQRNVLLSSFVLFLLSCSLVAPKGTVPAATQPPVVEQTEVPTEAVVVTEPPTVEEVPTLPPTEPPAPADISGQIARGYLEAITADGPRPSGGKNEVAVSQYISETFTKLGYTPETTRFSAWDENDEAFSSQNVFALKKGDSPLEIIVGAHYDSGKEGDGVDDNASGVAVMLEVAERVANLQTPYSIRFIAFGSEENDLDGSYYYMERMEGKDVANTIAYINLDSLAAGDITYVYSDEGEKAFLRDWLLEWAGKNNVPLQTILNVDLEDEGDYVADYGAFKDRGIPYIYFEATNWTLGDQDGYTQVDPQYGDEGYIWHTPFDTLEYLEATFPGRVDEHLKIFASALFAICTEFQK